MHSLYLKTALTCVVGNARIQGLEADLGMHGDQYNIALLIFFVPYILFEVPSNIFIKKLKPSNWLSLIMFVWGIATICQGLVHNFGGLVACRVIIGFAEAGYPNLEASSLRVVFFRVVYICCLCITSAGSCNNVLYGTPLDLH